MKYPSIVLNGATALTLSILLAACGGGGDAQPPQSSVTTPPVYVPPVAPPPAVATPVMLNMTFEHTQDIQNLYASGGCKQVGKVTPCTVQSSVLNRTRLWIATDSNALADGALSISEIADAGIRLQIYWDGYKSIQWLPGELPLQFAGPSNSLVAYQSGAGWRLYESARIKRISVQFNCVENHAQSCRYADVSQSYAGIIQVEMVDSRIYFQYEQNQMFLTGTFYRQ